MRQTSGRRARRLVAACLSISSAAVPAVAADYWQVQAGNVTVVAAGKKVAAAEAATAIVRTRHAVRWIAGWPADYRPRPVLAVAIPDETIDRYFERPKLAGKDVYGRGEVEGIVVSVPETSILIFSPSRQRGQEFNQLQGLYGKALLDTGPSADWPECARQGMGMILATANLRNGQRLYAPTGLIAHATLPDANPYAPRKFINSGEVSDDLRTYSCYVLSMMALRGDPIPRAAFAEYFTLLGARTEFGQAAQSAFGISDDEFTEQLKAFGRGMRFQPRSYELHAEIGGDIPQWSEPEPISAERMHNILSVLAAKMKPTSTP